MMNYKSSITSHPNSTTPVSYPSNTRNASSQHPASSVDNKDLRSLDYKCDHTQIRDGTCTEMCNK